MASSQLFWLGAMTSPIAFLISAFANFSLPSEMQKAFGSFSPSASIELVNDACYCYDNQLCCFDFWVIFINCFLILTFSVSPETYTNFAKSKSIRPSFRPKAETDSLKFSASLNLRISWAQILDNLSYRILGIGFPLLTIGILSGAVWANEAWGSYWSWDPKETWALLTWLVFAIYLHTRISKNWYGKKPAIIASFGFFVVWVCYLGVNLLGEGLHSYGWLQS